jgi:hypothetical protein
MGLGLGLNCITLITGYLAVVLLSDEIVVIVLNAKLARAKYGKSILENP